MLQCDIEAEGDIRLLSTRLLSTLISLPAAALLSTAASAQGVLKIGEVNPYSGPLAVYCIEVTRGREIAVDEINAAGGVLGRKIELIRADATNP